jgi:hypothetical protein
MPRGADRQKFRKALDDGQDEQLKKCHEFKAPRIPPQPGMPEPRRQTTTIKCVLQPFRWSRERTILEMGSRGKIPNIAINYHLQFRELSSTIRS